MLTVNRNFNNTHSCKSKWINPIINWNDTKSSAKWPDEKKNVKLVPHWIPHRRPQNSSWRDTTLWILTFRPTESHRSLCTCNIHRATSNLIYDRVWNVFARPWHQFNRCLSLFRSTVNAGTWSCCCSLLVLFKSHCINIRWLIFILHTNEIFFLQLFKVYELF